MVHPVIREQRYKSFPRPRRTTDDFGFESPSALLLLQMQLRLLWHSLQTVVSCFVLSVLVFCVRGLLLGISFRPGAFDTVLAF